MTRFLSRLTAVFALLALTVPLQAQTWTGTTSGVWGSAANWTTAVPVSGNTATFLDGGNGNLAIDMGGVANPIGSIIFDTAAAGAYTFSGNTGDAFVFDSVGALTVNATVTAAQTFNTNFLFKGAQTTTNNGTGLLTLNGGISLNTGSTAGLFTVAGTGNTTINGVIATGSVSGLTKTGAGVLTLTAANTFATTTTLTTGSLVLKNALALQNSTLSNAVAGGVIFDSSIAGNAFTIGGLAGTGAIALQNNAGTPAGIALTLGGNNAGTTYTGVLSGAGSLTKVGTGTTALNNAGNSFTGNIVVNAGILLSNNGTSAASLTSSFGAKGAGQGGRTITVNSGGQLRLTVNNVFGNGGAVAANMYTVIVNAGGIFSSSRFNMIGNIVLNGGTLTQAATDGTLNVSSAYQGFQFAGSVTVGGTSPSLIEATTGRGDHLRGGTTTIFNVADVTGDSNTDLNVTAAILNGSGDFGGQGALNKTGLGTMRLSVPNLYTFGTANGAAYSGLTTVSAGTFIVVPTAIAVGNTVTVLDGAQFGAFGAAATSVSIATLNLGTAPGAGGAIRLEIAGNTGSIAPLAVTTALNPNGTVGTGINVVSSVLLTTGQFPLISYPAGGIGGAGFGSFYINSLPLRVIANLVNNTANFTIDLNVTGTDTIRWNGGISGIWDINTTQNWKTSSAGTLTTYLQPSVPGDIVNFNDLAVGNFSVSIPANVNPSSVTVDNTVNNYTFSGAGAIAGVASLTKNGTGSLTILNNNTFIGGTTINAGSVIVGNGGTTGSIGTGAIVNNGSLTINRSDAVTISTGISGTGELIKAGAGTLTLSATNTYIGGTTVNGGTLLLTAGNNGTGAIRGTLTINAGATVLLGQHDVFGYSGAPITLSVLNINGGTIDKLTGTGVNETFTGVTVNLSNGATMAGTGGYWDFFSNGYGNTTVNSLASATTNVISGQVNFRSVITTFTVNAGTTASGTDLLISGALTGPFGLTKEGAGKLVLTGNNTYGTDLLNGTTSINNGILQLGNGVTSGNLGATPIVNNTQLILNPGLTNSTVGGAISGAGVITKLSPNMTTLSGSHTYTGDTNITAGTLRYKPTALTTVSGIINVATGARLSVAAFDTASTVLSAGTVNLSSGAGINFELVGGTVLAPLSITTLFNPTGSNTINLSASPIPANGQYPLIAYPGSIGGAGFAGLSLGILPVRMLATLVNNTANSTVDINITGTDTIRWQGNVNGVWDINTTSNWFTNGSNVSTTYLQPTIPGEPVLFNDLATGTTAVTLAGNVSPISVTFDHSTKNYSVSGAGGMVVTGPLVKNGTGTLTLNNVNTFTGELQVNGGSVVLVGENVFTGGLLINAGSVSIGNGGTTGSYGTGAIVNNGNLNYNRADDLIIGTLHTGTGTVTKSGTGSLQLTNVNNNFTGNLTVVSGTLIAAQAVITTASANTSLGSKDPSRTITVNAGAFLLFPSNNIFGGAGASAATLPTLVINGTLTDVNFNILPNLVLNGGTLDTTVNSNGNYQAYQFIGTVTIGGTSASTFLGPNTGYQLLPAGTDFNVADVFGNGSPSLIVNTRLADGSGDYPGVAGLTKSGPGTMVLASTSTYTGGTTINGGVLQLGNGTVNGVVVGIIQNDATLAFNPAVAGQTFANVINGSGGIAKYGPNTLTLTGLSTFSGPALVRAGTLRVQPTALPSTVSVTVENTANFSVFGATSGAVAVDSITTLSGAKLSFELVGNTAFAPLTITTSFAPASSTSINVSTTLGFTVGQFPLIAYPGSISGSGFGGLTLGTLPLRVVGTLVNNTTNSTVDLNITGIDTIRWNGNVNANWDINTTQNWRTTFSNVATNYLQPTVPGDVVAFNDLAVGNYSVNIVAPVSPASVTVNNTTNNYTFSGAAITGVTSLTKSGTGSLTILNDNTYTGVTTVTAGSLVIGNGGTIGSIASNIVNNGAVVVNRSDAAIFGNLVSGTGTFTYAGTGSLQLTNTNNSFTGDLVVASGNVIAANVQLNGVVANTSLGASVPTHNIIVNTGATLTFNNNNIFGSGGQTPATLPTLMISGTVYSTRFNLLPNVVLNGGTLDQSATDGPGNYEGYQFSGPVSVIGANPSTISSGNGRVNHLLNSGIDFNVANITGDYSPSLVVTAPFGNASGDFGGNAGNLSKSGAGIMLLTAVNTYTGNTTINAGTLQLNGSLAAGGIVTVNTTGTLSGTGTVNGDAALVGGSVNFDATGKILGVMTVDGGSWNGLGSVTGAITQNSGVFSIGSGANLTSTAGLTINGGTLAGVDSTARITGSVTYSSPSVSTFNGKIAGSGSLTVTSGELILNGGNSYSGVTNVNGGILTLNNSLTGPGGAITIADGAVLQASGVIQRPIGVAGTNQSGILKANGALSIVQLSPADITFDGHLNTQGNFVQYNTTGDALVRSLSLSNGAVLTSGTSIKLANNVGGSNQGETGVAYIDGSVTIGGVFWAGRVTNDSGLFVGAGINPGGDNVTFTGILRGSLNNFGVNVTIVGLDREGWSPTFSVTSGANFNSGPTMIVVNSTTKYSPTANTFVPLATGGHFTTRLAAGTQVGNVVTPGTYTVTALTSYTWDATPGSGSQYSSAFAKKGDAFEIVRTDGSAWGTAAGTTNTNGSILNPELVTLPNGIAGGNGGSFLGLPNLPAGLFWHVDSTASHIQLYVGGFVPFGDGVWKNGGVSQNWSSNTGPNNNWATAQPFAAGQTATFDSTVTNYAGGVVNVDVAQTVGNLVFNKGTGGGYTIGANNGFGIVLDNGAASASILVSNAGGTATAGSHTVAAPIMLASNLIANVGFATDTLTLSGGITGVGKSFTKAGSGTVVLNGNNDFTGATNINAGTLTINNSLTGAGGAVTIADNAVLQAQGVISRSIGVTGANQSGMIKAIGTLTITQSSGITFDGHLNTQGNFIQYSTPGDALVRSISMSHGATLTSGTAIKLANNVGGSSPGDTGVAYIDGTVTIGGTFWAGRVTGDSGLFVGAGTNPNGDNVTFPGILRGVLNNFGVNVTVLGQDREGWSPAFAFTLASSFGAGATVLSINTPTQWTPIPNTTLAVVANSGGHTQRLISGRLVNGVTTNGFYVVPAVPSYTWAADSTYNAAAAVKGDTFTFVRTDSPLWGAFGTTTYVEGIITNFAAVVLPNGTTGGSVGSFSNLPTLPSGSFWHVDATAKRLALYVGGFVPYGSGTWRNGSGDNAYSTNTAADNNWGTAQPFAAGQIATFDSSVLNFNNGVVNVDAPVTLGGLVFNRLAGGYAVSGSAITLNNGASAATITVSNSGGTLSAGSHTVIAGLTLASHLSVAVDNALDTLTLGGVLTGSGRTLTKTGAGTLAVANVSSHSGATTVSGGTFALTGTGSIAASPLVSVASGATLRVNAVTGGLNHDGTQFALASGQTLSGTGTVLGNTAIRSGSFVTPAASAIGMLTVTGNLVVAGGTYTADVSTANGADLLAVSGGLNLGSGSVLDLPAGNTYGAASYVLIQSGTGIAGTFTTVNNLPSGYTVDYGTVIPNAVVLTGVPEPALLLLAATLLGGATRLRRRPR